MPEPKEMTVADPCTCTCGTCGNDGRVLGGALAACHQCIREHPDLLPGHRSQSSLPGWPDGAGRIQRLLDDAGIYLIDVDGESVPATELIRLLPRTPAAAVSVPWSCGEDGCLGHPTEDEPGCFDEQARATIAAS